MKIPMSSISPDFDASFRVATPEALFDPEAWDRDDGYSLPGRREVLRRSREYFEDTCRCKRGKRRNRNYFGDHE
jgi:hypothetical protein